MPMQFMNSMADDPRTLTIAEKGIKESPVYESLKLKILAKADLQRRAVPKGHQVALMRLGQYTDGGWKLLQRSMAKYVDLAAPSTVRNVRFQLGERSCWVIASPDICQATRSNYLVCCFCR
jgi:hypothetical protein